MLLIKDSSIYPLFVGDLLLDCPEWSEESNLPDGWEQVQESEIPAITAGKKCVELFPENIDGVWYRKWQLLDMTEAEKKAMSVKEIPEIKPTL